MKFYIFLFCFVCCANAALIYKQKFRDCHERHQAGETKPGVYTIFPHFNMTKPVKVYCNHNLTSTSTVIQQQIYGKESFIRPFLQYRDGFGTPHGDLWLGLNNIHYLTNTGNNKLTITMQDWNHQMRYITYTYFRIDDQSQGFRLNINRGIGNIRDDMSYHNGMFFYTYDYPDQNQCVRQMGAGWWYNNCAYAMLNGKYYNGGPYTPPSGFWDGIFWKDWLGHAYSLKFVQMALSR